MAIENKKEQEREELHRAIWAIADELRGAVDGWDFKNYVLGTMFYRYISENLTAFINQGEVEAGDAEFDYAVMDDGEAEEASMFDETALQNLQNLVVAKQELLKRAFQVEELKLEITEETVGFPWFLSEPDSMEHYTLFVQKICEMAIKQKRIQAKEKEVVNEKYEFRCFLLRLGLIGDSYKAARKFLMKNLSGSAAFKNGKKKEVETE